MTFADINNVTLLNWYAQATSAQNVLNSRQAPPAPAPVSQEAQPDRPAVQVVGLTVWVHSLETEMRSRGLGELTDGPAKSPCDLREPGAE